MILTEPITIRGITIPKGFECDLISFPFLNTKHTYRAGLFHDYGYRRDLSGDRKWWDTQFRKILIEDGACAPIAWCMYFAVRLFSWTVWNKVRNKKR